MENKKQLIAYDPITFESFTRHSTKHREPGGCQYDMGYVDAVEQIEDWLDANTVNAVEVVRCKDCKHLMFSNCYGECKRGYMGIVKPWDFCSYGERKDNDIKTV